MGLFSKKIKQLEENDTSVNITKEASEKAVDIIKELAGKNIKTSKKLIDNLVVFTNASGGTGTSTIVSNVAYLATKRNLKVLLIDLNIMCPVQHAYLGIKQKLEKPDLVSYLLGKNTLSESISTENDINLIYSNNRTLSDEINCNSKLAISNFTDMLTTCREYYDLVLVDCPMRIDSMLQNVMLYEADSIYIVWDEGISSIMNTEKIRRNMAFSGIDSFTKMRVILNKKTFIHYSDYPFKKLNLELVSILPFDPDIIDNSHRGQIFSEKGSSNAKNAIKFAHRLDELTDKVLKIGGYI